MTPAISIIVPTRGRPEGLRRMVESAMATASDPSALQFVPIIDDDDDSLSITATFYATSPAQLTPRIVKRGETPKSGLWNYGIDRAAADIWMIADDDLVFQTQGWDCMVLDEFAKVSDGLIIAWGPDGSSHCQNLAMHTFLHRKTADVLGYIQPPFFSHDFGDVWMNEIFDAVGRKRWLPDLYIEHRHVLFGKAPMDATYAESFERGKRDNPQELYNSPEMVQCRQDDIAKLRRAIGRVQLPEPHTGTANIANYYFKVSQPTIAAVFLWHEGDRQHVERLLRSLDGNVDGIVAIQTDDSGPYDFAAHQTPIHREHFPWCDDFAAARNYALSLATTDWVLSIDADEELILKGPDALRTVIARAPDHADGLMVPVFSRIKADDPSNVAGGPQMRCFRRERIQWRYRVHEQPVRLDGSRPTACGQDGFQITHWGYMEGANDVAAKHVRNERLLAQAMADDPANPANPMQLAEQVVKTEPRRALKLLEDAIRLWRALNCPEYGYVAYMFTLAIRAAIDAEQSELAQRFWMQTPNGARTAEQAYLLGLMFVKTDGDKAVRFFRMALEDKELLRNCGGDPGTYGWKAFQMLGHIYLATAEQEKAKMSETLAKAWP